MENLEDKVKLPRIIAFYLPQYHPIPENDQWWGKGFTEWTNVVKAKPLFKGHYQPHIPADLGFYDLRVPEVREQQAEMAREAGIEGFCYWHYWFAGKRLLERPFNEVLESGKPDFPFCLAWANESWRGVWHGAPGKLLIEQTYPGYQDYQEHFLEVLPSFQDPRYITVEDKPVFVIYKYAHIPNLNEFTSIWRKLALANGLKGIYFVGIKGQPGSDQPNCLDGWIIDNFIMIMVRINVESRNIMIRALKKLTKKNWEPKINYILKKPYIYSYKDVLSQGLFDLDINKDEYPLVFPNWDNTPRSGFVGTVLRDANPDDFYHQLLQAKAQIRTRDSEKQIIFIKSWNEWAEGNHLEPDLNYGKGYLNAIRRSLDA